MVLTDVREATPDWLTGILKPHGLLEHGGVVEVRLSDAGQSPTSTYARLDVQYADFRDSKAAPDRFFLKLGKPGSDAGGHEAVFYNEIMPPMRQRYADRDLLPPRCYHAAHDPDSGRSHLLLAYAEGYFPPKESVPPSKRHSDQLIDNLARFHAFWWENPRLGDDIGRFYTHDQLDAFLKTYQSKFEQMQSVLGERLHTRPRQILERIATQWPPSRRARLIAGKDLTVVHQDTQPKNFLFSFNDVLLVDWQSWRVDFATDDLAYMIVAHWPAEARKKQEQPFLKDYHRSLRHFGVTDYDWDAFMADYRGSVVRTLGKMLAGWTPDRAIGAEWTRMTNALRVYDDLECDSVFD